MQNISLSFSDSGYIINLCNQALLFTELRLFTGYPKTNDILGSITTTL